MLALAGRLPDIISLFHALRHKIHKTRALLRARLHKTLQFIEVKLPAVTIQRSHPIHILLHHSVQCFIQRNSQRRINHPPGILPLVGIHLYPRGDKYPSPLTINLQLDKALFRFRCDLLAVKHKSKFRILHNWYQSELHKRYQTIRK